MMRRFCMSGVSRHNGAFAASRQVTCVRLGERAGGRRQEEIFLDVDRLRPHMLDRFGVEIGEAGVELEILDAALDFLRCSATARSTVTPGKRA